MEDLKLPQLIDGVMGKLEDLNYSKATLQGHRTVYNYLNKFAAAIPTDEYSEELGLDFLDKCSSFRYKRNHHYICPLKSRGEVAATAIRKLGEFKLYGTFSRRTRGMQLSDWAMEDYQLMLSYDHSREQIDVGKSTMNDRLKRLRKFYLYLESIGIRSVKYVTPEIISDYLLTEAGYSKVTIKHTHKQLRNYFRFLHTYEHLPVDFSGFVPSVYAVENASIPMIWSNEDVEKLLASIDLSSPTGIRNYAIILLVAELGIRGCDVISLKKDEIDWGKKEICFIQNKTGVTNNVPMTDRVGWAIINYMRYARPKVDSPYVFLTVNAPYTKLGGTAIDSFLDRQMQKAGIKPNHPNAKTGIYTLRHSLARKLLDKNVPLEDIADIMGHTEITSSSPYLKVDVEGLRRCSLSLEDVMEHLEGGVGACMIR